MSTWDPTSWQSKPCAQAVPYLNRSALERVLETVSQSGGLVTKEQILSCLRDLKAVFYNQAFLLQAGDCAESFRETTATLIERKQAFLAELRACLGVLIEKPICLVGRLAGQCVKPRSEAFEWRNGHCLPSYRGDGINAIDFEEDARTADPQRMQNMYDHAKTVHAGLDKNLDAFYTSHEALNLYYEQALTRQMEDGLWYNLSTHFPWVGWRTGQLEGAHFEYCRGIANPIGIKIGVDADLDWLLAAIEKLNPLNQAGKLVLIPRFGAKRVQDSLPRLLNGVLEAKKAVIWSLDPMHGNTRLTQTLVKTRDLDAILLEIRQTIEIHKACGSVLQGIHLELSPEDLTECLGGPGQIKENDLQRAYYSLVDPRLNREQSLACIKALGEYLVEI